MAFGAVYGVVLLPESAQPFIEASGRLSEFAPSCVRLNDSNSRAHMTVVHVEGEQAAVESMYGALISEIDQPLTAECFSLYLRPGEDRIWVGLEVRRMREIQQLHDRVLAACAVNHLPVISEHGDSYWPHITLGRWQRVPDQALPLEELPFGKLRLTLALALMGEHGVVAKVLG